MHILRGIAVGNIVAVACGVDDRFVHIYRAVVSAVVDELYRLRFVICVWRHAESCRSCAVACGGGYFLEGVTNARILLAGQIEHRESALSAACLYSMKSRCSGGVGREMRENVTFIRAVIISCNVVFNAADSFADPELRISQRAVKLHAGKQLAVCGLVLLFYFYVGLIGDFERNTSAINIRF